ncbi:MAG: DNA topoisomerase 3 [Planctomycetota bacterium]
MEVILTEKPSVAREIAAFVGARTRHDGYLEGSGYQITWAYGHLVELKEPHDYDPALKRWSLESLPFIPVRFELKLIKATRSRQQFDVIKRLFQSAERIICATDAGREGELIFRYILAMTGCEGKPLSRLWLSSLTPAAIRAAFGRLRPGSDYDRLYAAARCRSEADWIVGLNATRNYTVRYAAQGLLWSVGRVQTPVLAMIVERDDEIRTFKPEPFWELMTRYRDVIFKYRPGRFARESDAQSQLENVQGHPFTVIKVDRKEERSQPPQLYDLTELQRDMNRRFGLSADATLKAAQALYEAKLITYPRTDSRYLSSDMKTQIPGVLRRLKPYRPQEIDRLNLDALPFSGRIINDRKVTDHHAIIPAGNLPENLPSIQQRVFEAVLTRLIAVFYPPCLKEVTSVDGTANRVPFRARGVRVVRPGWTELDRRGGEDQEDDQQPLPAFTPGESGSHEPLIKQGETSPPHHFTENTLLGAMETAGKLVDDDQLKEALKSKGLGTPATRAAIIETLLKRRYIQRDKKNLLATDLGRYLVAIVRDVDLKSPELTGQWESKLRDIEAGRLAPERFMEEITQYTSRVIREAEAERIDEQSWGSCPRCGCPVIQGKRGYGCSAWKNGCKFVLWSTYKDCELDPADIRELLLRRVLLRPIELPGAGRVILALTCTGEVTEIAAPTPEQQASKSKRKRSGGARSRKRFTKGGKEDSAVAASSALGNCPLCAAEVREQPKSYSCSGWKQGCKFVIWKTIAGKRISGRTAKTLLAKGQTRQLKGLKSKAGKPFEARLKLVDGEVHLDFSS